MSREKFVADSGGIIYSGNKPLVPDGKLPPGSNGCSIVYADGKLVAFGGCFTAGEVLFVFFFLFLFSLHIECMLM